MTENTQQFQLDAKLTEIQALRSTPAGIAAINFLVQHSSLQTEAAGQRIVQFEMQCICLGALAECLTHLRLGKAYRFKGFLAPSRKGAKTFRLHVTEIVNSSERDIV